MAAMNAPHWKPWSYGAILQGAEMILQAALAFNLICSGTLTEGLMGKERPVSIEFRVDLKLKRYCAQACPETFDIAAFDDRMILFVNSDNEGEKLIRYVNRESGKYYAERTYRLRNATKPTDPIKDVSKLECKRAPFSGFPARKF
ncbi:hypothetical protein OKW76_07070 [Sphingomonas sp. S1-29]|uniref:hypothetical protein n=1 Tax=Sphingomonas sp. S1-29 TaxID=2991074 RepID=UPI00223EE552|nr:hypothetical protein [Sphingomonas sp. S1-29]UZK70776.1 hypothetical protein OKW76_07070 [Sphingomonas sp. S1-29]